MWVTSAKLKRLHPTHGIILFSLWAQLPVPRAMHCARSLHSALLSDKKEVTDFCGGFQNAGVRTEQLIFEWNDISSAVVVVRGRNTKASNVLSGLEVLVYNRPAVVSNPRKCVLTSRSWCGLCRASSSPAHCAGSCEETQCEWTHYPEVPASGSPADTHKHVHKIR